MARLSVFLVVALLVGCAMADRYTILGRTSDPCADIDGTTPPGLQASIVNNCQNTGFPQSATTIYIPSEGSGARVDPQIAAGGRTVTIGVTDTVPSGNDINLAIAATTSQWLCLAVPGGDCTSGVVLTTCSQVTLAPGTTTIQFTIPPTWDDVAIENEDTPRALCRQTRTGAIFDNFYIGLNVAVVYNCAVNTDCTTHPGITQSGLYSGLNTTQARLLATRTVCCVNPALGLGAGICINTNVQTCCGGAAFEPTVERCCDVTAARIRGINQPCPCFGSIAGGASNATGCPATESCCLPTKFSTEFATISGVEGRCFLPGLTRCCNTGETYDPGAAQCCVINGIQSLNTPCPCGQDAHCLGASLGVNQTNSFARCCRQRFPSAVETPICTPFANFPSTVNLAGTDNQLILIDNQFRPGQNIAQVQRCPGVCVDTRFQMCCNGVACVQGYEKCCNNTCCNKFVGKCAESYRAGTPGSRANSLNFGTPFQTCTIIENLGPLKTYWVFVLPTFLLVATLGSLALVIIYASSHTTRAFSFVERAIVVLAVLQVLLAIPLFFSPAYKYGITIVIVGLIAILSASARVWWLNVLAVGATIVLLLFLIDPFHGNWFFNFANGRLFNGNPDPDQMGILHTLDKMWTGTASYRRQDFCVQFYDYFSIDPLLNDVTHKDQLTLRTFGFCYREWVAALLIIELFNILLALLIFVLVVLALTLRFRKVAPIPVAAVPEPAYVDLY